MIGVTSGYKVWQNVRCKHGSSMKDVHSGHNTWWWFCHLLAHIAKETTSLQPLYVIRSRQVVGRQVYLLPSFIFLAWVICIKGHLVEQMFNPFWQIFNSFIFPFARTIFLLAQSQAKVKSAKDNTQKSQNISHTTLTFVNGIRQMVSFKLSQEIDKDIFPISPHKELSLRPPDSAFQCSTTEPQRLYGERGLLWSSYMTCVLYPSVFHTDLASRLVGFNPTATWRRDTASSGLLWSRSILPTCKLYKWLSAPFTRASKYFR